MATKKYQFVKDYKSDAGTWKAGEIVDISEDTAAWFNRDVDGCLEPYSPKAERAPEKPEATRQVTKAEKRGEEKPISRADFKATVDKG